MGKDHKKSPRSGSKEAQRTLRWMLAALGVALLLVMFQVTGSTDLLPPQWREIVKEAALMLSVCSSASMAGALVGFLFGVPRRMVAASQPKENAAANWDEAAERSLYGANTNLEQVSDWLTKIIIGVGLVEFTRILRGLESYGTRIGNAVGRPSALPVNLMIFFFIAGFFIGYLGAALFLGRALTDAEYQERLEKENDALKRQAQADADAIAFAHAQLKGAETLKANQESTKAIFEKARTEVLTHIFYLAAENRHRHYLDDKPQMERSIIIFKALTDLDKERRYHRTRGELGFSLKEQRKPDLVNAEYYLTEAIEIRGEARVNGWQTYEATRAVVRIMMSKQLGVRISPGDQKAAIIEDLQIALSDEWTASWLRKDPHVVEWATNNNFSL